MNHKYTIAIIGGGIIGSSIAYFLARTGQAGSIVVIEPDPTYTRATTPNGAGGVRQLFSQPENVWMSQYSLQFYKEFAQEMAVGDKPANIDFNQRGYLFVVGEEGAKQLEINHATQSVQGVNAHLLDYPALATRFPSLGLDDIVLGCHSPDDGTLDTTLALRGFRDKAESLGVIYLYARVTALECQQNKVISATLDSDETVTADVFVNAAGPWAQEVTAMVGQPLPVVPICRVKHFWTCPDEDGQPAKIEPLPLVKDESGVFFRPLISDSLGTGYTGGRPSWEIKPGFNFAPENASMQDYFADYFTRVVQPLLTTRLPAFQAAQCQQSWAGHYAQNTLDGNMILGPVGDIANFYVACGFSGHGIMHTPAIGLALSELILTGQYQTMDLSRMSYQRVIDDDPYPEQGII
ncbi:MAG: FAD-binding oxidoreductase [Chloroflexota bacterium]